eukprot:TRINITY_DN3090_c0_g1_i2.p1 TRINITY_DN3090_c0_g1~~TRINITY_DN3090_c0_g1_i2.p1  ORF type:complete len:918 (+),score=295.50 TRINITY_DN3090_c0_g1_i2:65-2818(+)
MLQRASSSSTELLRLADLSEEAQASALLGICDRPPSGTTTLDASRCPGAPTPQNSAASISLGPSSASAAPTPCNTADSMSGSNTADTLSEMTDGSWSTSSSSLMSQMAARTPYNSVASLSLSSQSSHSSLSSDASLSTGAASAASAAAGDKPSVVSEAARILSRTSTSSALLPTLPRSMLELQAEDWDKILYGSVCISFSRDDLILVEGEANNNLFLITSGAVRVEKRGRFIARIDAKENVFGDIGYLLDKRPSASIIADTNTFEQMGAGRVARAKQRESGRSTAPERVSSEEGPPSLLDHRRNTASLFSFEGVDVAELHTTTVRVVSRDVVSYICAHDPIVAGKFHRFLAIQLSRRLRRLLSSEQPKDSHSPINLAAVQRDEPSGTAASAEDKRLVKLRARFNLFDKNEELLGSYHCSWSFNEKKASDGRIYITNYNICFYSKFFGFATKYRLARAEVKDVRKRGDSHIFIKMINGDTHAAFSFDEERNAVFELLCKQEKVPTTISRATSQYSEGEEMSACCGQLTKEDWVVLSRVAEHRTYDPGEVVVREGRRLHAMYQLVRGAVRIEKDGVVFDRTARADVFGEVAFLDKEPASATVVADKKCQFYVLDYDLLHSEMGDVCFASRLYHYIAQLLANRVTRVTEFLLTETSLEIKMEGYLYLDEKWCWSIMSPSALQIFNLANEPVLTIKFKNLKQLTLVPPHRVPRTRKPIVRRLGNSAAKDAPASYFSVEEIGKEPVLLAAKTDYKRAEWLVQVNCTALENQCNLHGLLSSENQLEAQQAIYLPPHGRGDVHVSLGFSWRYKGDGRILGAAAKSPDCSWDGRSFNVVSSSAAGFWNGHRLKWVDDKKQKQLFFWSEKTQSFTDEASRTCTFFDIVDSEEKMGLTDGSFSMVVSGVVPQPVAMFLYLLSASLGE